VNGLITKGLYYPSIRRSGDISEGALSTGESILNLPPIEVNEKESDSTYAGHLFTIIDLKVHELIGRSFAVSAEATKVNKDSLVGVIARSAGAWENDKQVCSCSGKTIWQERTDAHQHGLKI
jgi:copper chaperone for superoxide dismutase